jgi:hypothetical protein
MLIHVVLGLLIACSASARADPPSGSARGVSSPLARVRPADGRSAELLLEGVQRSRTFRALLDELEDGDLIVYVEAQPGLDRIVAGQVTWMAAAGRARYIRISVNPTLTTRVLVATLGHELQHAVEIAREPSIVDPSSLDRHYAAHGIDAPPHLEGWDTQQARVIGEAVRREIAAPRRTRPLWRAGAELTEWHAVYRRAREMPLR